MSQLPMSSPTEPRRAPAWPLRDDRPMAPEPARGETHGAALVLAVEAVVARAAGAAAGQFVEPADQC